LEFFGQSLPVLVLHEAEKARVKTDAIDADVPCLCNGDVIVYEHLVLFAVGDHVLKKRR
jgi:hypothetical protein